jgi:antitoxin CptB
MSEMDRLRWRCRRGMLELDLLLQGFLEKGYEKLDVAQQEVFARLLELQDQTLQEYLLGSTEIEQKEFVDVIKRIRHAATP